MEFVRRVVNGSDLINGIEIPDNLLNKKVELLIFPIDKETTNKAKKKKSLSGALSKYANPDLIYKEYDIKTFDKDLEKCIKKKD